MAQVRANQMKENGVYVMRTFRRKGGSNYQYDMVRFVARTNTAKLNELTDNDKYTVIIDNEPVTLVPYQGVLSRVLDGRHFRVTFQTEDTATDLGLTSTPQSIDEVARAIAGIDDIQGSIINNEPLIPVEPVIPPEPVEPVIPPKSKARKPLTPAQKARKNELARARRAAAKAV